MPRLFTYLLCTAVVATLAGGAGGSFQPARLVLIASALLLLISSKEPAAPARMTRQMLTMAGVMALGGGISLFWTADLLGGLGILLAIGVGALSLYIVMHSDLSPQGVGRLTSAWLVVIGLSLCIAFYELATGNHFQFALDDRTIRGLGQFPFASVLFGNYNDYSAWLCLGLPITMGAFLEARSAGRRLLVLAVNLGLLAVVFVNTSRGAIIYASLVCIVYFVRFRAFRSYAIPALLLAIPFILIRYADAIRDLYGLATLRFEYVGAADESYSQRSGLIDAGIEGLISTFGFGIGAGGFEEYISDYYNYLIPNPHNIFLEIAVNFGLIPLVAFVVMIVRLFFAALSRRDIPQGFRMAVLLGTLGVPIIGVVPSQAIGYVYWWVWFATLCAMVDVRMPQQSSGYFGTTAGRQADGGRSVLL